MNFGHTFAHAYEASLRFSKKLNHGEAVLLGTNTALEFSNQKKILNEYPDWKAKIIGDEKREKIVLNHTNAHILGFLNHDKVLQVFKKTSIAVACSRWEEPFGRTSLEASSRGCAVIISDRGGLPETISNGRR